jgi:hypothetical protein
VTAAELRFPRTATHLNIKKGIASPLLAGRDLYSAMARAECGIYQDCLKDSLRVLPDNIDN